MKYCMTALLALGLATQASATETAAQLACINEKAQVQGGVFLGKKNTLFYIDEFKLSWNEWDGLMKGVGILTKQFSKQNVKLIFVPVPTRPLLFPELLDSKVKVQADYLTKDQYKNYQSLIKNARSYGVDAVDLALPLKTQLSSASKEPNYFARDFHWTQAGAAVAAKAVASTATKYLDKDFEKDIFLNYLVDTFSYNPPEVLKDIKRKCKIAEEGDPTDRFVTLRGSDLAVIPNNIGRFEAGGASGWRWLTGPSANFQLMTGTARTATLNLAFVSPVDGQSLTVRLNNKIVYSGTELKRDVETKKQISLPLKSGRNTLTFEYGTWNRKLGQTAFSGDDRQLALRFNTLRFDAPGSGETNFISETPYPQNVVSNDLLIDATAPVVLTGSSYSNPDLNFAGFLKEELGTDVLNASVWAGGSFTSIRDFLWNTYQDNKPRILIWEAPLVNSLGNNPADIREIQGMVNGPCERSKSLVWNSGPIGAKATINVTLPNGALQTPSYLYLKLKGTSQKIRVDELVGGNLKAQYYIDHGNRSQNRTEFWLRLPAGPATSFNVSLPEDADASSQTTADVGICNSL